MKPLMHALSVRARSASFSKAFTVVELLVIIVTIGILAGVSTVGYGKWRESVAHTEVKSDLNAVGSAMASARSFDNGYPTTLPSNFKSSPNVTATYITGTATTYCIEGVSKGYSSIRYHLMNGQTTPQSGPCPTAPSAPVVTAVAQSANKIDVTWPAVPNATSYTVKYGTSTPTTTASCTSSPCELTGLTQATTYYISVTASNSHGTSAPGNANATTTNGSTGGGGTSYGSSNAEICVEYYTSSQARVYARTNGLSTGHSAEFILSDDSNLTTNRHSINGNGKLSWTTLYPGPDFDGSYQRYAYQIYFHSVHNGSIFINNNNPSTIIGGFATWIPVSQPPSSTCSSLY